MSGHAPLLEDWNHVDEDQRQRQDDPREEEPFRPLAHAAEDRQGRLGRHRWASDPVGMNTARVTLRTGSMASNGNFASDPTYHRAALEQLCIISVESKCNFVDARDSRFEGSLRSV